MSYKGLFTPKNPQKYKGDPTTIIYRSSWELRLMMYLDDHPDVIQWASEEFAIPYKSPLDGGRYIHRYFPDFWVKKRNPAGKEEVVVIEVKPYKQTMPPKKQTIITKRYINEVKTWGINEAKWKAAKSFCTQRNWKFLIITEKNLGVDVL